jgi:hypothetical protein
MISGIQSGNQQAAALMPSVYQPLGRPKPRNPYQGTIDLLVNQVLELAHSVKTTGGDGFRDCSEKLLKISYELTKINNMLTEVIQGDDESGGY